MELSEIIAVEKKINEQLAEEFKDSYDRPTITFSIWGGLFTDRTIKICQSGSYIDEITKNDIMVYSEGSRPKVYKRKSLSEILLDYILNSKKSTKFENTGMTI